MTGCGGPRCLDQKTIFNSKEAGTAPDRAATTDGKVGIGARYIIGAVVKDAAAAPVLCKEVKHRFKLDVPLTL